MMSATIRFLFTTLLAWIFMLTGCGERYEPQQSQRTDPWRRQGQRGPEGFSRGKGDLPDPDARCRPDAGAGVEISRRGGSGSGIHHPGTDGKTGSTAAPKSRSSCVRGSTTIKSRFRSISTVCRASWPACGVYEKGTRNLLAQGERPFDVTNDFRTNFRYAGEVYPNVVKRLKPNLIGSGETPDDFWDAMRIDITPEESLDGLYSCYLNAANVSVDCRARLVHLLGQWQ